jgi:hypothetical protein
MLQAEQLFLSALTLSGASAEKDIGWNISFGKEWPLTGHYSRGTPKRLESDIFHC